MKVILFGGTGMVGQGVLRECLMDPQVETVLSIGRKKTGQTHPKLRELEHADFTSFAPIAEQLSGYDACFFALGISSVGLSEAEYRRITYDYALAAATVLAQRSPAMTFIFVSGGGTNAQSSTMWARVKGETEQAIMKLPFKASYMFRPGFIQPLHGIRSKTTMYNALYAVVAPLVPLFKALFPNAVTTTEIVGKAMLQVVRHGAPTQILESRDINAVMKSGRAARLAGAA